MTTRENARATGSTDAEMAGDSVVTKARGRVSGLGKAAVSDRHRRRSAKPGAVDSVSVDVQASPSRAHHRVYSKSQRAEKLAIIEKSVGEGKSVKEAVKEAGVSEPTYYLWKRSAGVAARQELNDLLELEEENARLKKLLAERLRSENAELRKKLGLS